MKKRDMNNFILESNIIFLAVTILLYIILVAACRTIEALVVPGAIICASVFLSYRKYKKNKKELNRYLIDFTNDIDDFSRQSLLNLPIPLTIIDEKGDVYWYNSKFKNMAEKAESKNNIVEIVPAFSMKKLAESKSQKYIDIQYGKRNYHILFNKKKARQNDSEVYLLYWIDNTNFKTLMKAYNAERVVIAIVEIDNYDEISKHMDSLDRVYLVAEIEKELNIFAQRMNGFSVRYLDNRFLLVFESRFLENLVARKFDILDSVKQIKSRKDDFFTLAIGVGTKAKTINQQYENAYGALTIALGRGGDQAVVKSPGNVSYYGGKSKAVEKRTKVKARTISYAIRQVIVQSSAIFIVGHKNGDMDSFGASVGIYAMARSMEKKAYIVIDKVNTAVNEVYNQMSSMENYEGVLINSEDAVKLADKDSLCFVVDTHKPSYVESPEILNACERKVLIDHHRRGEEYIADPILDYLEPYASSTCEMIAEFIQYMEDIITLEKFEADVLLSGIILDTNAFTFKTGVRTFEAASFLRRAGADTVDAKRYLCDDIMTWKRKSEVIEKAEILFGEIALSQIDEVYDSGAIVASQSAADLLSVKGIKASFVLVRRENEIHISGRSLGDINVQMILEQLNGGGHLEIAGAQIKTDSMEKAKADLLEAIKKYRKEEVDI